MNVCNKPPFVLQKVAYCMPIRYLLKHKRCIIINYGGYFIHYGENDTSLFDKYFDAHLLQIMYFGNPH